VWGALIIAAVYMLRAIRQIWHGPLSESWREAADPPTLWRKTPFMALLAALIALGVWPRMLTDRIEPSARQVVDAVASSRPVPAQQLAIAPEGTEKP
jgi:NADH-quinone oxidoreductase subunit M